MSVAARKIGRKIKAWREDAKLSQKALAEKAQVSQTMISAIEQGTTNPSVETLELIAAALEAKLIIELKDV